jgi:glycerol uptake facilitator protein
LRIGSGLLLLANLGIVDSKAPAQLAGLVIGGAVVGIILVLGPITGACLNPARALGPELVAATGSGTTHRAQYVPVYFVPGLGGAALAALVYDWLNKPAAEAAVTAASRAAEAPAEATAS